MHTVDTNFHGRLFVLFLSVVFLCVILAPASYHNYHHSHNKGNYATFFCIWDTIFGTNQSYYEYLEKRRRECKQIIE